MFENKRLKQLQDIQTRIKDCKKSIEKLQPPRPDSFKLSNKLYNWLEALSLGYTYDMLLTDDNSTYDYLHKLGEYFINIANYHNLQQKYNAELRQLQKEEARLKEKLGID